MDFKPFIAQDTSFVVTTLASEYIVKRSDGKWIEVSGRVGSKSAAIAYAKNQPETNWNEGDWD